MQPEEPTEAYQTLQGFHTRSVDVSQGDVGAQPNREGQPDAVEAVRREAVDRDRWPSSTRSDDGRALPTSSSTSSSTSSGGAATPSTTSPTSRGVRTRRSRCRASPASSTWTTARIPSCCTGRRSASARSCSPRPGRSWPTIPTRSRSSTSSTRRPATASRSPRTTRSTSTSSASACSAGSRWLSATGSCRRVSSTVPTTCSSSTATRSPRRCATVATGAPMSSHAGRRFEAGRQGRAAGRGRHTARRSRPMTAPDPFMDAIVFRLLGMVPPEENPDPNMHQGRGRLARRRTPAKARVVRSLAEARTSRRARSWCAR